MNKKAQLGVTEDDEVGGYLFFVLGPAFIVFMSFAVISYDINNINEGVFAELEKELLVRNVFYSNQCFIRSDANGNNLVILADFNDEALNDCVSSASSLQAGLKADLILENSVQLSAVTNNFGVRSGIESSKYKYPVVTSSGVNGILELTIR